MSKVQHCRPAAEVINALLETGETLETLAVKLDTNSFTLSRYNGGVYGNMTSYPTLRKKIEIAYGMDTGLFDPGAEIKLPKTDAAPKAEVSDGTVKPVQEEIPAAGKVVNIPTRNEKPVKKKPAGKKDVQADEIKPAPEGFMEIPGTPDEETEPVKPVKKAKTAPKAEAPAKATEDAGTDDMLPGQLTFGDVFGSAAPKPAENDKPLTYEQMSAKLQSELCGTIKAAFASLKDSHKESMPKKPVFAGKEASELVDIMAKLSTDDIKVLLAMARRMVPPAT